MMRSNHIIRLCGAAVMLLAMGGLASGQTRPTTLEATAARQGVTESGALTTQAYDITDLCAYNLFQDPKLPESRQKMDRVAQEIGQLVTDTISPASWKDNHGQAEWHLVPASQALVVTFVATQTAANHAAIKQLFSQLRKGHAVQVTVETRFVTTDSPLPIDRPKGPASGADEMPPDAPILDDAQVQAFTRAAVANKALSIVSAPRVTIYNGEEARVRVDTLTSYVAAVVPKKNREGQMRYEPVIDTTPDGVSFQVRATVMANGRSVGLQVSSMVNHLAGLETFAFMESPERLTVQQARKQEYSAQVCCVVPDRQTLIIGPLPISDFATTRPTTVPADTPPALGKLPVINRLFASKADGHRLYILVKPTIIGESAAK